MPSSTGTAPTKKLASIGSCSSHAPSAMPNSGVMNENTPRRDARYLRNSQNHSKKLANDTTTEWNNKLAQRVGVGLKCAWPVANDAPSSSTKAASNW